MDYWNPERLEFLAQCFLHTLSPVPEPRRAAEKSLSEATDRPHYGLAVLRLVSEPSVDDHIRHAAAVNFKNHLRSRWLPCTDSGISPIIDLEKEQIKTLIVTLMLSSSPRIQSQLSEALAVIGKHDFPKSWPALLPELISNLQKALLSGDYTSVNGILGTANSIFKRFRYQYRTDSLFTDLKYCLDNFAAPLTEIFKKTSLFIDSAGGSAAILKPLFECQRLCCRIFYSLNFQDLPEFFEDHMNEWMVEFIKYLSSNYPALESTEDGLTIVDDLRVAVCENINLYMEKNEEEFKVFLEGFATDVWRLLQHVSKSPSRDQLATTAIKFLTTISTSVHHALFAEDNVIRHICQSIVIPNVSLRDEDEELFGMNYVEFIRRDMEGSDVDTRRRIACELLKGLATNYKTQVTQVVSLEIKKLLSSSLSATNQWKDKDCAIYLVISLATKRTGGVASVSKDLIDVQSFFTEIILRELQSRDVNSIPMLKAGSLKFLTMFRSEIPKAFVIQLFPELVRFLKEESNVVHSYAASCIEKLLLVKEEGGKGRYAACDISPFLPQLMKNLFAALKFQESEENQYLMKCTMRVLGFADINGDLAGNCTNELATILSDVCVNPKNPVFNHYLFESLAVLVRRACERDASFISKFESSVVPRLLVILANDITELLPYSFQLLAQLVKLNRPPLSQSYMDLFSLLLKPNSWERKSNVPALVRLLQAFLEKAPHDEVTQKDRLSDVLWIFEKLVSSRSTDEQGFYILNTVIESLDYSVIEPYMERVWSVLFTRLQKQKTVKFQKSLVIFMPLFLVTHGHGNLVETMNTVGPNIFTDFMEHLWIPNVKLITGNIEVKLTAVAGIRLIFETPALKDPSAAKLCGKMLDSIVTLVSRPEQERVVLDEPEMPENVGYTAAFVNLYNAGKKEEEDPLSDITDPKQFVVASVARLSYASPGRYPQIIGENLGEANQAALLQLCNDYNCGIV